MVDALLEFIKGKREISDQGLDSSKPSHENRAWARQWALRLQ